MARHADIQIMTSIRCYLAAMHRSIFSGNFKRQLLPFCSSIFSHFSLKRIVCVCSLRGRAPGEKNYQEEFQPLKFISKDHFLNEL